MINQPLFSALAVALLTLSAVQAVDWCNLSNCKGRPHIACNNSGTFPSPLPSTCVSPLQVNLTAAQIQQFVDGHNFYRNKIALGSVYPFEKANRMAKMTWDSQLAEFTRLNTLQCTMNPDACHNTENYNYSGQNLASFSTVGTYTTELVIDNSLFKWFNESSVATMTDINKLGATNFEAIKHFTLMVNYRCTKVGCAMATWKTPNDSETLNAYLVACNYASNNMLGQAVYYKGQVTSRCVTLSDTKYPGLCKQQEPIDPNGNNN